MPVKSVIIKRQWVTRPRLRRKMVIVGPPAIVNRAIVLSDDDPDMLTCQKIALEDAGFVNVYRAEQAAETMRLVRSVKPTLLVTDMMKQGITGQDMARLLKAEPELSNLLVLLSSAIPENYHWDRSVFCGFIQKPYRMEPFVEVVRLILGFGANALRGEDPHDDALN